MGSVEKNNVNVGVTDYIFLLFSNMSSHFWMRNTAKKHVASENKFLSCSIVRGGGYMTLSNKVKRTEVFPVKMSPLSDRGSNQKMGK